MPKTPPNLGLLPWITVQCSLPHKRQTNPDGTEATFYERVNGSARLVVLADPRVGLPFGKIPRILLAHLVSEYRRALAHKPPRAARTIELGRSWPAFLRRLGMDRGGGRLGGSTRFQEQAVRLLLSDIQSREGWTPSKPQLGSFQRHPIACGARFWWSEDPSPEATTICGNYVELSEGFAKLCEGAVPVNMDRLVALRSSFAIDLYSWLSYRCGRLHEQRDPPAEIPWTLLRRQWGHDYARLVDFRRAFRRHLLTVLSHYPARVDHSSWPDGIVVYPHPPDVPRR